MENLARCLKVLIAVFVHVNPLKGIPIYWARPLGLSPSVQTCRDIRMSGSFMSPHLTPLTAASFQFGSVILLRASVVPEACW